MFVDLPLSCPLPGSWRGWQYGELSRSAHKAQSIEETNGTCRLSTKYFKWEPV